jgi:hypothetical protein
VSSVRPWATTDRTYGATIARSAAQGTIENSSEGWIRQGVRPFKYPPPGGDENPPYEEDRIESRGVPLIYVFLHSPTELPTRITEWRIARFQQVTERVVAGPGARGGHSLIGRALQTRSSPASSSQ